MAIADPYADLPDTTPVADPYADLPDTSDVAADQDAAALWDRITAERADMAKRERDAVALRAAGGESGGPIAPGQIDAGLGAPASLDQVRHLVRTARGLPSNLPVEGVGAAAARGFTGGAKRLASALLAAPSLTDSAIAADREAAETTQPRNIVAGVSGAAPLVAGLALTRGRMLPAAAGAATMNPATAASLARLTPATAIATEIGAASLAQNVQDRTQTPEEAIVNAAIEAITTRLGGAAEPFIGMLRSQPGLAARALQILKESGEEATAGFLQSASSQTLGNQRGPFDLAQAGEEAGAGAAAGAILGTASAGASAIAQDVEARRQRQRAVVLDALRNLGGEVDAPATADPIQVDPRTAELGKALAPVLGPEDVAREEAGRAIEASAANDTAIRRQRLARALADEAADISADRRAGMESLAKADDEAQRQMEVRAIADEALGTREPVGMEQVAEGRAPDVAETPEERRRFDTLDHLRQETDQRHQLRMQAIYARRRAGEIGKPQAAQEKAASEAQRAREYAEAAQAVADGQPLPSWSALAPSEPQEVSDAEATATPRSDVAAGAVPVPRPARVLAAQTPQAAPAAETPPSPAPDAGQVARRARVVPVPNGQGFRVAITDGIRPVRFLRPGSQPVAAQEAQTFATADEAEQAARASLGDRWDVGMSDQAKRTSEQARRDAEMQKAQQEAGDQAVADVESRARAVIERAPDATHYDLLREMSDYGFRVDKSQQIPAGADARGLALRQALARRGEDMRTMFDRIKGEAKRVPPAATVPTPAPRDVAPVAPGNPAPMPEGQADAKARPAAQAGMPDTSSAVEMPPPMNQGGTGMTEDQAAAPLDDDVPFQTRRLHDQAAIGGMVVPRLKPEPLPSDTPSAPVVPLRKSIDELADRLGATIYDQRKMPRRAAGYYRPSSGALALKSATDLDAAAHEISHWNDDRFGIMLPQADAERNGRPNDADTYDRELAQFWDHGSSPPRGIPPEEQRIYRRGEGLAEYLRAWMVAPGRTEAMAPMLTARMRKVVPAEVLDHLRTFGDNVRRFYHAPGLEQGGANVRALGDTGPGLSERLVAAWQNRKDRAGDPIRFGVKDWLRLRMTDSLAPLEHAIRWAGQETGNVEGAERAEMMVRLLGGVNDKTQAILDRGMVQARWIEEDASGKPRLRMAEGVEGGIDWLAGWVDPTSQATIDADMRALDAVLVAESAIEDAANIDKDTASEVAGLQNALDLQEKEAREALDKLEASIRAKAEAKKRANERHSAGRIENVRTAAEKAATGSDEDMAKLIDREQAADKAASAARARMAKRNDGVAREVLKLYEAIDQNNADVTRETEKKIERMRQQLDDRIALRRRAIARQAGRWSLRDAFRKQSLTGQGGGVISDQEAARRVLDDAKKDPERWARIQEGAKRYRAWADGVLRYMVDKGRLSMKQYLQIKARHQQYAALHRIVDEDGGFRPIGGGKLGTAKDTIKGRKGSTRTIDNPLVNLIDNTMRSVHEADRNEAMRAVVDVLNTPRAMHSGKVTDIGSVAMQMSGPGDGAVAVYRNGEVEHWKFAPEVEQAIRGLWEQYRLPPIVTLPATILREAIVNTPMFAIRNRIRDTVSRFIIGQVKADGALATIKRLAKQLPGAQRFTEVEKAITQMAGGAFAGHYMGSKENWHREIQKRVRQLRQDRNVIVAGASWLGGGYMRLIKGSEFVGRADEFWGIYRQLRKEGIDEQSAAQMAASGARKLVDFAVAGTWVRTANQAIPFLNAAVQGLRAEKRAFTERPMQTTLKWMAASLLPSLAAYALAAKDDRERDEYVNMPAWRRDLFWNLKVAPNTWLAIPKPFLLGAAGSTGERLVQAAHEAYRGKDPKEALAHAFEGHLGSLLKATIPVDEASLIPAIVKPIIEIAANHDFFSDKSIVPDYDRDRTVANREGTAYASRMGQLGQFLSFNSIDARNVDHIIRGYLGNIGSLAMGASDIGSETKAGSLQRAASQASGIVRAGEADRQADVQRLIETEQEADRTHGRPIKRILSMKRDYWKATTGTERDEIAAAMRAYATGDDYRLAIDRAASAVAAVRRALSSVPLEGRAGFQTANVDALRAAVIVDRMADYLRKAEKVKLPPDQIRKVLDPMVEHLRKIAPGLMESGDIEVRTPTPTE